MLGICEFCGKEKEVGESTPFHGTYCKECMQVNMDYDCKIIEKMQPSKSNKTKSKLEKLDEIKKIEILGSVSRTIAIIGCIGFFFIYDGGKLLSTIRSDNIKDMFFLYGYLVFLFITGISGLTCSKITDPDYSRMY